MGARNHEGVEKNFYKLNAKTADGAVPHFVKVEKKGSEWVETEEFNELFGLITGITHEQYTYEGELKNKAKVEMTNPDGSVDTVDFMFNNATFSFLNSLLGSDVSKEAVISVWVKENEAGKRFAQLSVKFGGQKSNWKYRPEELPKPEVVKVGNKDVKNWESVEKFWIDAIPEIHAKVVGNRMTSDPILGSENTKYGGAKNFDAAKMEEKDRTHERSDEPPYKEIDDLPF